MLQCMKPTTVELPLALFVSNATWIQHNTLPTLEDSQTQALGLMVMVYRWSRLGEAGIQQSGSSTSDGKVEECDYSQ